MTPSKRLQSCLLATMAFVVVLLLAVVLTPTSTAQQQPARLALLIGNKGYTAKVGPLKNPHRDVDLVEASLKRLGFKVTVLKDATYKQMDTALKRYVTDVRRAGRGALSFFYYSGHGVANPETGINYLIPVDVSDADDDKVWFESFQQNIIIDTMSKQAPGATHYLVFDACRNELNVTGDNAKAIGVDKGFVPVADTAGLLIAYATAPKRTASDAGDSGGPYAKVLAEELVKPGVESVTMFRNVQIKVKQSIGQDPWLSFPSLPPVYLAGQMEAPPAKQPERPLSAAAREWQDVKGSSNRAVLEAFRKRHERDPVYAALADEAITKMVPSTLPPAASVAPARPPDSISALVPGSGKFAKDCPTCPEIVVAPSGEFMMGSTPEEIDAVTKEFPAGAEWFKREGPRHKVSIARPFAVGRTHITRGEFAAFVTATGHNTDGGCNVFDGKEWKLDAARSWRSPGFDQTDAHPVVCVNWNDATAYAAWLSKTTDKGYRLLSEAEAEYVARATTRATSQPRFFFGNDYKDLCTHGNGADRTSAATFNWNLKTVAPCHDSFVHTAPVASFKANAWGLHDVHGNAWTWTADCFADSYAGAPSDGSALTTGECVSRVLRGGSWNVDPQILRSADRGRDLPDIRLNYLGFRLARTLLPSP